MPKKKIIKQKSIVLFENIPVRRIWSDKEEKWYFAIMDIVEILTGSVNPPAYWRKLKERLKKEGNQTVTNCHGFKMRAKDGKIRDTDCFHTEDLFRIIQSIPSPKAEPFKIWRTRVGYERLREIADPELAINRARRNWKAVGRSGKWIEQRMRGQEIGFILKTCYNSIMITKKQINNMLRERERVILARRVFGFVKTFYNNAIF